MLARMGPLLRISYDSTMSKKTDVCMSGTAAGRLSCSKIGGNTWGGGGEQSDHTAVWKRDIELSFFVLFYLFLL